MITIAHPATTWHFRLIGYDDRAVSEVVNGELVRLFFNEEPRIEYGKFLLEVHKDGALVSLPLVGIEQVPSS